MVPSVIFVFPMFLTMVSLDLTDTLLSLILGYVCITLPFCLWLMWAFFRGVPIEIEEAALVDGASRLQVFRQVVLPVALPGIIAASIFSLIVSWNDYLFGRVFMNSMENLPLTVGVMHFFDGTHVDWGLMMASSVLMTLPMAILFGFMQRHLVAGFGSNNVLKALDLLVPSRQFVTLLGPSGCGKTTLLRLIAGLERGNGGEILFGENRVDHLPPGERNIAMVFQSYALYPTMDVARNIGYGLEVRRIPKPERSEKISTVAKVLEIGHLLLRKPKQLSGGQRQRVALGRAMARRPDIFLMDEPLSNLDAKLRSAMRGELRRFHLDLGTTTIYVTHDQLEAMTMSDLVVVMNEGIVQQIGTPEEVYSKPANLFVAGFIGTPPMNLFPATNSDGFLKVANTSLPIQISSDLPRELVIGIRPQEVSVVSTDEPGAIPGKVWMVELIGSERLIEVEIAPKLRITAEVRAKHRAAIDDHVAVRLDPTHLHIFDPVTGKALSA
jgi:ABC-type sugar transport system ATPase subunit